jgi:hypothetical protein
MLAEVLGVFVIGILVGQVLRLWRLKPRLWSVSAVAASALLFSMGLSIGLERGMLLQILPEVAGTSLLLGSTAAVSGAIVTFFIRGRKRD